jgi:hypothetical protein
MKVKWFMFFMLGLSVATFQLSLADEDSEVATKIPATISGIWGAVKEGEANLSAIITDKKLDKVHVAAYAIRDLVNALPDKSTDLPADNLAKVKSYAKYVADLATRLDVSGDAGDQDTTEANFKKLQNFLKSIEDQYTPQQLKSVENEEAKQ